MSKVIRLDRVSATKDPSLMLSGIVYTGTNTVEVENGTVVSVKMESGVPVLLGREEFKFDTATATTLSAVVCTPEVTTENSLHGAEKFINKAGDTVRAFIPTVGDIFSISGDPTITTIGGNKVVKLGTEKVGNITYTVFMVVA